MSGTALNAIDTLINYIEQQTFENLPSSTIAAAKTFILDSVGVGLSGSRVGRVAEVKAAIANWGADTQAQVWSTGEWLPAASAAAINGFQIHNQEWDCVHEGAVVHPMATILSSLVAYAQRECLTGKELILGVTVAVDVATLIGNCATSPLKFFRPSVCGSLGATAGICAMLAIKGEVLKNALGIAYSNISGTMQAHVEGSPMLAMQIALNSQGATHAADLARAGFAGPHDILEGPFGYFDLFEDSYDLTEFYQKIGKQYQIEQVSHKPFPTGRAGHGAVDGLLTLQQLYGFTGQDVKSITVHGTPLINRLVARPIKDNMDASYAKLCNGYIAATALLTGNVNVTDFDNKQLQNKDRLNLGKKIKTVLNDCQDPNALAPVTVEVTLKNDDYFKMELPAVLGNPQKPLMRDAQVEKFYAACRSACVPFSDRQIEKLINSIDELEQIQNINTLVKLMVNNNFR